MTKIDEHPSDTARAIDRAYFRANPKAKSYVRQLLQGELAAQPGLAGVPVAVAYVSERMTIKALVLPGENWQQARRSVEKMAARMRGGTGRGLQS